jgi:hypothetical protein
MFEHVMHVLCRPEAALVLFIYNKKHDTGNMMAGYHRSKPPGALKDGPVSVWLLLVLQ